MSFRALTLVLAVIAVVLCTFVQSTEALSQKTINTILRKHNTVRAKHHAPALKWNKKVAAYAQKWSNKCVFEHSYGGYGENLGLGWANWGQLIIDGWYDEYKDYNYSNPGFSDDAGHFTQVVWKNTTEIGCGVATCDNLGKGAKLYTCSYDHMGNIDGLFATNVLKP
ncbi:hypothetical protein G6F56_004953 [Rhizopus delemar]|uniref:SCP domain-containing protein n=1 Tax=Rhizopus stolonifer TaxID=4846 RepID=A0A367IRZ2_RHIST|nr:hypothetical protein G6F56_004953 [Rhizopus delemar]RCH80422.1 hypothetical protein CU098_006239 [Rhizopus stolonifer]